MQIRLSAHGAYQHQFHLVWIPKYRRRVLKGNLKTFLAGRLGAVHEYHPEVEVEQFSIQVDHGHLGAIIPPKFAVSAIVGKIKANTSREIRQRFPWVKQLYWRSEFWSEGFFSSTVGMDEAVIKRYVEFQEKGDKGQFVDVCDDVDVTLELLEMDAAVKQAGIAVLLGMGSSPGMTNVVARFAADALLDTTHSVDILHTHGGEPTEGAGVIEHSFHCMSIPIPMSLDGRLQYVNYFEPDGVALRQTFTFPYSWRDAHLPLPPPRADHAAALPQAAARDQQGLGPAGGLLQPDGEMVRLGMASKDPIQVRGQTVVPYDFAIAFIIRERERILREANFGRQRGCVSVIVRGTKDGRPLEYRFHMASTSQALGEGTGIPAAMGAILMQQGKVQGKGVLPPEACLNPFEFWPKCRARPCRVNGGLTGMRCCSCRSCWRPSASDIICSCCRTAWPPW